VYSCCVCIMMMVLFMIFCVCCDLVMPRRVSFGGLLRHESPGSRCRAASNIYKIQQNRSAKTSWFPFIWCIPSLLKKKNPYPRGLITLEAALDSLLRLNRRIARCNNLASSTDPNQPLTQAHPTKPNLIHIRKPTVKSERHFAFSFFPAHLSSLFIHAKTASNPAQPVVPGRRQVFNDRRRHPRSSCSSS
jgi:hypothetical protein